MAEAITFNTTFLSVDKVILALRESVMEKHSKQDLDC